MQAEFVRIAGRTGVPEFAALKAGYSSPQIAAWKLLDNPEIAKATREEARRFLRDQGGAIGVYTLASIAIDERQTANARVSAAHKLAQLSGIAVTPGESGKELSEMTGDEMANAISKLERQRQAMQLALSDRAKPVLDLAADDLEDDVFG